MSLFFALFLNQVTPYRNIENKHILSLKLFLILRKVYHVMSNSFLRIILVEIFNTPVRLYEVIEVNLTTGYLKTSK